MYFINRQVIFIYMTKNTELYEEYFTQFIDNV